MNSAIMNPGPAGYPCVSSLNWPALHGAGLFPFISRGGAGGAQEEGAAIAAAPSTVIAPVPRGIISRAYVTPAKRGLHPVSGLQQEKEH